MNERNDKIRAFLKFAVLIILIIGVPVYLYFFQRDLISQFSDIDSVRKIINDNSAASVPLYILFQILQIVICVIPGQWLQFAAGIAWGFWRGYLISLLGAFLGSTITYYLARYLGADALQILFGKDKIDHYTAKLNSKAGLAVVFLIYLVPGLPKDLCNYAAGISKVKLSSFLLVSLVGRSPGMIASILIGKQLSAGSYHIAVIIGIIACALFLLGIIFREKLFALVGSSFGDEESGKEDEQG